MPRPPRLKEYEKELILDYARKDIPAYKIAILVHHSPATVCNVLHPRPTLREMGADSRCKLTVQQAKEIKALRREGVTIREISEQYGIHPQTVFYHTNTKVRKAHAERCSRASKERWSTKPKEVGQQVMDTQKKRRQLAKRQKEAL